MPRLFQYPIVSAPVFVETAAAEEITLDKWFSPVAEPIREVGPTNLIYEFSADVEREPDIETHLGMGAETVVTFIRQLQYQSNFPSPSQDQESTLLDKWFFPTSEPIRESPFLLSNGIFLPDPARLLDAEFPSLDKWQGQFPVQHLVPIYPVNYDPITFFSTGQEFLSVDRWLGNYPDQFRVIEYPVYEGLFLPDYARLLDAEFPSVDKWLPVYPQQIFRIPFQEGYFELPLQDLVSAEVITLDKWFRPVEQPIFLIPLIHGLIALVLVPPLIESTENRRFGPVAAALRDPWPQSVRVVPATRDPWPHSARQSPSRRR